MDTKGLRVEIKDEAKGLVTAVFATFNTIDSDRDVTLPGAFDEGAEVPISAYGHTSWEGALPAGKGTIRQTQTEAILDGEFFLDTAHGMDTFTTVKRLGALGQWSYGYDPAKFSYGEFDGQQVRFLEKQLVHEVSPCLVGAGVNTRTLSAKSAATGQRRGRALPRHETALSTSAWDGAKTLAGIASDARPSELRTVYAWVDADGDPEQKSSYRLAHHHGIGGPANLRACLAGIAVLNGPKSGVPDADRQGVYDHLAGHLRDADIDVPELKAQPGGPLKYLEEGHAVLAAVSAFSDRTAEVVALRALKGRGMAPSSAALLGWIDDEMTRLKSLLTTPVGEEEPSAEEIASLLARSYAQLNDL
jgi:hypothetical protein